MGTWGRGKMLVQVKKVSGETFDVEVQDNQMPVGQFKQALANLCGIAPPQQRLICNGQNLEDHAPLAQYGIPGPQLMLMATAAPSALAGGDFVLKTEPVPPSYNAVQPGQKVLIPQGSKFCLGVGWDVSQNSSTDLDASCVCFDAYGDVVDVAFFNSTNACSGAVMHSGDNKSGIEAGDDEVITIVPQMMPPSVIACVLVCTNQSGTGFGGVQSAFCRVFAVQPNGAPMPELCRSMPSMQGGAHQGLVLGVLSRPHGHSAEWSFQGTNVPSQGNNWEQSMPQVLQALGESINVAPTQKYVPGQKGFNLTKGETIDFEATVVRAGLGWDVAKGLPFDLDLDASVLLLDHGGNVLYTVYWGQVAYPGVQHHGDNLTGAGEGDDEQISFDLRQMGANVQTVLFVVNIYNKTGQAINFGMVDNEYCRLVDMQRGTEMCKYKLDDMASVDSCNTLVMCKLFRGGGNNNMWRMQALGHALNGPPTAVELARTTALDTFMLKLPVYSPVPAPEKNRKNKNKNKNSSNDKSDGCCVLL